MSGAHLPSGPRQPITPQEREAELKSTSALGSRDTAIEAVQNLSPEKLVHLQGLLSHGHTYGIWETPPQWFPGGSPSLLTIDLRRRVVELLPESVTGSNAAQPVAPARVERLLDGAVLSMTRYLLLCRYGPVGMGMSFGEPLDATRLAALAYTYLPRMAVLGIAKALNESSASTAPRSSTGCCFCRLEIAELDGPDVPTHVARAIRNELRRMHVLVDSGLWTDAPPWDVDVAKTTDVSGAAPAPAAPPQTDPHLPLPDDYVSEMGQKSGWLITHLGPSLLRVLQDFQGIWRKAAAEGVSPGALNRRCAKHLADFRWRDANGAEILALPFFLRLSTQGVRSTARDADDSIWPPKRLSQIFGLARALQAAHLFVVSLSSAPRRGESVTLRRSCVVYAKDGEHYAEGRTFKLVQRLDGELRDWVLPSFAVLAIEQQARLVALYERLTEATALRNPDDLPPGTHLWGQVGGAKSVRSEPVAASGVNNLLTTYAEVLGMEILPGGQLLRSHRFRKTLARLAALALTYAPKVLQDVLGHKSIEMTLYYILADKDLAAEIETVAKELRIMRAQTVVTEMLASEEAQKALSKASGAQTPNPLPMGGYGGPAASSIEKAICMHRADAHKRGEDWSATDVRELAEVLTMQGKTWQLVRPGVLCTKSAGQAGPCNKKKGKPEPSRCQTICDHRLEEAWHREDVDLCIAEALKQYVDESERGEDLVASLWAGQVRTHVGRFPDLHAKWMGNPTVREIFEAGESA